MSTPFAATAPVAPFSSPLISMARAWHSNASNGSKSPSPPSAKARKRPRRDSIGSWDIPSPPRCPPGGSTSPTLDSKPPCAPVALAQCKPWPAHVAGGDDVTAPCTGAYRVLGRGSFGVVCQIPLCACCTSATEALKVAARILPSSPSGRGVVPAGTPSVAVKVVKLTDMYDLGGAVREAGVAAAASGVTAGMDFFGARLEHGEGKSGEQGPTRRRRFSGPCATDGAVDDTVFLMAFAQATNTLDEVRAKASRWGGRSHLLSMTRAMWTRLAYAHQAGILHCDIKEDNVMWVGQTNEVRFVDTGISEWIRRRPVADRVVVAGGLGSTHSGLRNVCPLVQSPAYRCPEVSAALEKHEAARARGTRADVMTVERDAVVSTATDVFAAASLSWLVLTGSHPLPVKAARDAGHSTKALARARRTCGSWSADGSPSRPPCKVLSRTTCMGACGQSEAAVVSPTEASFRGIAAGATDEDAVLARAVLAGMHCESAKRADATAIARDTVSLCRHRQGCAVAIGSPGRLPASHVMSSRMYTPDEGDTGEAVLAAGHVTSTSGTESSPPGRGAFVRLLLRWCTVLRRSMRVFMASTFLTDVFRLWELGGAPHTTAACALVELMSHVIGPTPPEVSTDASGGTPASRLQWALCAVGHMLEENQAVFLGLLPTVDMWLPRHKWAQVALRALCETVVTPDMPKLVKCVQKRHTVPPRMVDSLRALLVSDIKLEGDVVSVSGTRRKDAAIASLVGATM